MFKTLTVRENLEMGAYPKAGRAHWAQTLDRIHTLFPILAERAGQLAGTLSGGEQQMLAIGRGLACAPRLLMLDEPSMGLAPSVADTIFDRISQIHREDGLTILLVEQRVAEALERSRSRLRAGDGPHRARGTVRDPAGRRPGAPLVSRPDRNLAAAATSRITNEGDDRMTTPAPFGRRTAIKLGLAATAAAALPPAAPARRRRRK